MSIILISILVDYCDCFYCWKYNILVHHIKQKNMIVMIYEVLSLSNHTLAKYSKCTLLF